MYGTFAGLWVVIFLGGKAGGSLGNVIFWIAMMFVAAMAHVGPHRGRCSSVSPTGRCASATRRRSSP